MNKQNKKVLSDGVSASKQSDLVLMGAKGFLFFCIAVLLIAAAVFGGAALGNENLLNAALENEASSELMAAEAAGSAVEGTVAIATTIGTLGSHTNSTTFTTSNVRYGRYYEGNSHGNQNWFGAGFFGNGGSGTVRQKNTTSTASSNIGLTSGSIVDNLRIQNLLSVEIKATVRSKNDSDGYRKIGYKTGAAAMGVTPANYTTKANLLSDYTEIASRETSKPNQTQEGTKSFNMPTNHSVISLAAGGHCHYGTGIGGRYPGQTIESITITLTSRDTAAPTFDVPAQTTWSAATRTAGMIIEDNGQVNTGVLQYSTNQTNWYTAASTITKTTLKWTFSASVSYTNYYRMTATDTSGNSSTSVTYDYKHFRLDGYAPRVLQVLYVRSTSTSALVTNGLSPTVGTPWDGDVTVYIQAEDWQGSTPHSSGAIYSSGVSKVTYNNTECVAVPAGTVLPNAAGTGTQTTSVTSSSLGGGVGKGWYKLNTAISENITNAAIVVYDAVGNNSGTVNASLSHIDKIDPIVESAVLVNNGVTLTTANAGTWFAQGGVLTLTLVDYATTGTLSVTRDRAAGIKEVKLVATQFSRNGTYTAGGASTAITATINPMTEANSVGKWPTGAYYMTRVSSVAGTVGTYYCYRYVITVPILYRTNYAFTITDQADNAVTQVKYNHTSDAVNTYKPNIDQTAPQFVSTDIIGYNSGGTSLGSAKTGAHLAASYLKFDIRATDTDTTGRNDGSGISKIEVYNSTKTTLLSMWTGEAYESTTIPTSLYVYMTGYGGTKDGTFRNYYDINTCISPYFVIIITDQAGNRSDMTVGTTAGNMQINPNGNSAQISEYTYVDNIAPTVTVRDGANNVLAAGSETYDGDTNTRIYEYYWVQDKQDIILQAKFGCSGATLYRYTNTLSDSGRVGLQSWPGSTQSSTYNKNNNDINTAVTLSTEGINYYSFKIVNGAGVEQAGAGTNPIYNIILKVKIDKTAPTYELLGFGNQMTIVGKDIAGMKASLESPLGTTALTETLLTKANSYFSSSFIAYYYIKDTFGSTADNKAGTSWLGAGALTGTNGSVASKAKATIAVRHSTTYSGSYNISYDYSNASYTVLKVELFGLSQLRAAMPAIYNSANKLYNLTYGANIIYNISFTDAVGNSNSIKTAQGSADLNYNVDPFPINDGTAVSAVTQTNAAGQTYNYTGDWTDLDVKYALAKQTSISPVVTQYKLVPMTDVSGTPVKIGADANYNWVDVGDLGSAKTTLFTLSTVDGSKCAYVYIRFYKQFCNFKTLYPAYEPSDEEITLGYDTEYIIRQDIDRPIITAVYFSRRADLVDTDSTVISNNPDILAYFKANFDGNNYTYTRLTTNPQVWTFDKFYMYIIATDNRGTGSGSGINVNEVYLWNQDNTQIGVSKVRDNINTTQESYSGESVYRSASAVFGYSSSTSNNAISFRLADVRNNVTGITQINTDTAGARILPRVDISLPTVTLNKAVYGTANTSYVSADSSKGKLAGKLSGDAIQQSLIITLNYSYGISGATIYAINMADFYRMGTSDPWGYAAGYAGTVKNAGAPASLSGLMPLNYLTSLTHILTLPAGTGGTGTHQFVISNATETKARYYYFIVSNISEYYDESGAQRAFGYLTAGDIFIDNVDPIINSVRYVSKASGQAIDINNVYTNDVIYAYYTVSDGASGIKGVYHLDGGVEKELVYISGEYMLEMTGNQPYIINVYDNASNMAQSAPITPKIDVENVSLAINTYLGATTTRYNSAEANNFTNYGYIRVVLAVDRLGVSGLNRIMYRTGGGGYANINTLLDRHGNNVQVVWNNGRYEAVFEISASNAYEFVAYNNIPAIYAKDGIVPSGSAVMYIAIDTVKPTLNTADSLFASIRDVWHNTPQVLTLDASDNEGGSGIASVIMSYKVDGVNQDDVIFEYDQASGRYKANNFALSHFVTYTITITDKAGNVSVPYTLRPALDGVKPVFDTVEGGAVYTLKNSDGSVYTANTWTKFDVQVGLKPAYPMSGAKVQYSTNGGSSWVDMSQLSWNPSAITSIPDSDSGKTVSLALSPFPISPSLYSVNTRYIFRIVTNSGLISDTLDVGIIKIDNEKPIFDGATKVTDKNAQGWAAIPLSAFASTDTEFTKSLSDWSSTGVDITLKTASALASGVRLQYCYYNVNTSSWTTWTDYSAGSKDDIFSYTSSTAGISYKFRYVSGSDMISKELAVENIRVDRQSPEFTLAGRTSYTGVTNPGGLYAEATLQAFTNGGEYTFSEYTQAKYVILRIRIAAIGPSGVKVTISSAGNRVEYANISGASGELYYYIPATASLTVYVSSLAGIEKSASASIKIDSAIPELYVASINGTKSTNWDDTLVNSWFTDSVSIAFGVGTYITGSDGLTRRDERPESGFTVQYKVSVNGGTSYTSWQSVSSTTSHSITTAEILDGSIYRFRIISGSGIVNELGQNLVYNGSTVATATAVKSNMLTAHPTAKINFLSGIDYNYVINLDKNDYYFTSTQIIRYQESGATQAVDSISSSYARYTYYIELEGQWVQTDKYTFKHGDHVRLAYAANYGLGYNNDYNKYLHRHTEYYTSPDQVLVYGDSGENDALNGSFQFRFDRYNYTVNAFFKREVDASFGNTEIYLQSYRSVADGKFMSTAHVYYSNTSLGLNISYKNMVTGDELAKDENGYINVSDVAIGGYLLTISFVNGINSESFILTNPSTVLLVKYFTTNGANPFTVNDQYDLERVSGTYYDSFTGSGSDFTLGQAKTYLNSSFSQAKDIVLTSFAPIGGVFGGVYNGNNFTVTWNGVLTASGTFGLFRNLTGTVKNLAISVPSAIIVENADNVGILAGFVMGGIVDNVWAAGEMTVNTVLAGGSVGGLIGRAENAQIGRTSAVYTDVRISHSSLTGANSVGAGAAIGGVVGRAAQGTYLNNSYSFGGMEIYYIDASVGVGAVIGSTGDYFDALSKIGYFDGNFYYGGGAFVNDKNAPAFIGRYAGLEQVTHAANLTYRDFVTTDLSTSKGGVAIANKMVMNSVLTKLYKDFGKSYASGFNNGLGTAESYFEIDTLAAFEMLDKYSGLRYVLTADIDMSDFAAPIARHKVFTGTVEGKFNGVDSVLTNVAGNVNVWDENAFGLFANFDGTFQNVVLNDLDIEISYTGTAALKAGAIAANTFANAVVNNIIAIGRIAITAPDADVTAGGLIGKATRGFVFNVFNMANIKVTAKSITAGGIMGEVDNTTLVNYVDAQGNQTNDAIFSLARVEAVCTGTSSVGAIAGYGAILLAASDMSKVFALKDNTYANGSLKNVIAGGVVNATALVDFGSTAMRGTTVSDGNLFTEVFVTRNLYPLSGVSANPQATVGADIENPFMLNSEEDFKYINNALYANYRIASDITFSNFKTIGEGLYFTGRLDGKTENSGSAEEGSVVALHNVTDALFYYNKGTVSDLSMDIEYSCTLAPDADGVFGAVAKYNSGTIRSVIVSGSITISGGSSVTASGFVGEDNGGIIEIGSIKNSISSVNLTVKNTGTAYVGGYIGVVRGSTQISFAIGQGNIVIENCGSYYAGWLAGRVEGTVQKIEELLENIQGYTYTMLIKDMDGNVTDNIPTKDVNNNPINYFGWTKT